MLKLKLQFEFFCFFFAISSNFSYFNRNSLQKILRPKDLRYFCEHKCVKNKLNKVDFEHITDIMNDRRLQISVFKKYACTIHSKIHIKY